MDLPCHGVAAPGAVRLLLHDHRPAARHPDAQPGRGARAFLNSCRHKGARLCHTETGHAERLICPYHAWTYDADGVNCSIKDARHGHYSSAFESEDHDLKRVPRLESYRGMVFASLNPDVPPLEEWLGDTRPLIDLVMDQASTAWSWCPAARSIPTRPTGSSRPRTGWIRTT
ncbi:MAG: Rieske 2Fe-2S domain-containing protein [Pseudomonadota bacterium]